MNELYSFEIELKETVLKKVEEEKRRKNKKTGKFEKVKVEVEKEVEQIDSYDFIVKKPNRKDIKEAEIFYSIRLNSYIKKGILTQKQVFNSYVNNGGILSDHENEEAFEALVELGEIKDELLKLSVDKKFEEDEEKKETIKQALLEKQRSLYDTLFELESQKDAIFSNSADNLARNDLIEWWIVNLTYFKKSEGEDEFLPFFKGEEYDQKFKALCEFEDSEDELYLKMVQIAAQVVTIWNMGGYESKEDFESVLDLNVQG